MLRRLISADGLLFWVSRTAYCQAVLFAMEMPTLLVSAPLWMQTRISGPMETATVVEAISEQTSPTKRTAFWTLAIGSIGVVYGDIGTSPLYALKESLTAASAGGA